VSARGLLADEPRRPSNPGLRRPPCACRRVELLVVKDAPPGSARRRVGRSRGLPVLGLVVGGGDRRAFPARGTPVPASSRRGAPTSAPETAAARSRRRTITNPAGGAARRARMPPPRVSPAIRTVAPSAIESGGFSTTWSLASTPPRNLDRFSESRARMRCSSSGPHGRPRPTATCRPADLNSSALIGSRSESASPGNLKCTSA